jgi:hypothetical protein
MLDHTRETPIDTVSLDLKEYPLDGFTFAENPLSLSKIARGLLNLTANLALRGNSIDLKTKTTVRNLLLTFSEKGKENLVVNMVKEAIKTAPSLTIGVAATGTRDNPQLSISSNIDQLFAKQLKHFAGEKVNEVKASLGSQISGASGTDMKAFSDIFSEDTQEILNQFGSDESLVQGKMDLLNGLVASKTGKTEVPSKEKGLKGLLPGLIGK